MSFDLLKTKKARVTLFLGFDHFNVFTMNGFTYANRITGLTENVHPLKNSLLGFCRSQKQISEKWGKISISTISHGHLL